jgi:hypothetical protein
MIAAARLVSQRSANRRRPQPIREPPADCRTGSKTPDTDAHKINVVILHVSPPENGLPADRDQRGGLRLCTAFGSGERSNPDDLSHAHRPAGSRLSSRRRRDRGPQGKPPDRRLDHDLAQGQCCHRIRPSELAHRFGNVRRDFFRRAARLSRSSSSLSIRSAARPTAARAWRRSPTSPRSTRQNRPRLPRRVDIRVTPVRPHCGQTGLKRPTIVGNGTVPMCDLGSWVFQCGRRCIPNTERNSQCCSTPGQASFSPDMSSEMC